MLTKTDSLLSQALVEKGVIEPGRLEPLKAEASQSKDSLFQVLLKKGAASEDVLLANLSEVLKIPLVDLTGIAPDPAALEKVPLKIAEYYKIVPIRMDQKKLTIALSSPLDLRTEDDIRTHVGHDLETVLARESQIREAIRRFYGFGAATIKEMMARTAEPAEAPDAAYGKIENIEKMAGDASIATLVNQIILEAYRKRASDIHIEPYRGKVKLRYRIDGTLYDAHAEPRMSRFIQPILSRIKIMSNLNIVERRLPQDGRAIVKVEDAQLDLRISSVPTPYGESVVIRMLPMNRVFDLARLGLNAAQLKSLEELIQKPHGIIFITGPTGSGKSTTLYACLNKINTDERKIITIEDPIEYEMEGITQIQVQSQVGLDFARGLRGILRHDPDVIMVGEVRDLETAEIAMRVALTGHLVFSTLHTNDAASGVTRLVDIGVEPYLVASSVEAFIAQRLVRKICPRCRQVDPVPRAEVKKQIAHELGRTPADDIKKQAVTEGMIPLRQNGWLKVLEGVTTPEEIWKVAGTEKETGLEVETELSEKTLRG